MMVPGKDATWNEALQTMILNEPPRQLGQPTQTMVNVGPHQGMNYPNQNNNSFISLQQIPRGITVYQPVVNTGIVMDFRNGNNTNTIHDFPQGLRMNCTNENPFEQPPCRVNNMDNAYNLFRLQTNSNNFANYPPPPPYPNYLQGNCDNQAKTVDNRLKSSSPTMPPLYPINNHRTINPHGLTMVNGQLMRINTTPNQTVTNSQSSVVARIDNFNRQSPQAVVIPSKQQSTNNNINASAVNIPSLTNNGMTITRTTVPVPNLNLLSTTAADQSSVYRKDGSLVAPTLTQLLDRRVQSNFQQNTNILQMTHSNVVITNKSPDLYPNQRTSIAVPLHGSLPSTAIPQTNQNGGKTFDSHKGSIEIPQKTNADFPETRTSIVHCNDPKTLEIQKSIVHTSAHTQPQASPSSGPGTTDIPTPKAAENSQPRKARLKISPRLGKNEKLKMWLSHFIPEPRMEQVDAEPDEAPAIAKLSLPEPDENYKWDMSLFPKCSVKVTKLPPEIEDIYFAKGNYKKSTEPLVYVVPTNNQIIRFKPLREEVKEDRIEEGKVETKELSAEGSLKTILKIKRTKKNKKNEDYKVLKNKKNDTELKTTIKAIKKYKVKRPNRSERSRCNFCGKMRKPADNWRHVMAIYGKLVDVKDQISDDQVRDECKKCGTKVCSTSALTLHEQHVHGKTKEVSYECFNRESHLKTEAFLAFHLQAHYYNSGDDKESDLGTSNNEEDTSNTCEICNRKFQTGCALASHRKSHGFASALSNKCSICSKVFQKASHLKAHFVVHTKERPFSCKECDKTFRFRSSLKQHSYGHRAVLPYKCKFCSRSFKSNWSLNHHTKKIHTSQSETCAFCDQMFTDRLALSSHMKLYHGKRYPTKNVKKVDHNEDIEKIAESLLKQLADEDMNESFGAMTETDEPLNEEDDGLKESEGQELGLEENECELCDSILTSVTELEKHLLYYHRVKDNKISKLLPIKH